MNIKELKMLVEIAENLGITDEVYFVESVDGNVDYSKVHATIQKTEERDELAVVFMQRW